MSEPQHLFEYGLFPKKVFRQYREVVGKPAGHEGYVAMRPECAHVNSFIKTLQPEMVRHFKPKDRVRRYYYLKIAKSTRELFKRSRFESVNICVNCFDDQLRRLGNLTVSSV